MNVRATSTPNIALIKYWGNRDGELRLPAADSLSMTLDGPSVEIAIEPAKKFSAVSFEKDGAERLLSERERERMETQFHLAKQHLGERAADTLPPSVSIEIRSEIPRGIGMASSAAIFSALAEGYAGFAPELSRKDVSIIARLGSGSASRSVFGGFVAMVAGSGRSMGASYAYEVAPSEHWKLYDVIIAPSTDEKRTSSTEGHALAPTSPFFEKRLREIPARQKACIEAIQEKDFNMLRRITEADCLDMHAVMESSTPPLHYLSSETHRIVKEIEELRVHENLAVLYTMDAGPTVHLICGAAALKRVREYANGQKNCKIFETRVGGGSRLL